VNEHLLTPFRVASIGVATILATPFEGVSGP